MTACSGGGVLVAVGMEKVPDPPETGHRTSGDGMS